MRLHPARGAIVVAMLPAFATSCLKSGWRADYGKYATWNTVSS